MRNDLPQIRTELRDGTPVLLRPVIPDDKHHLQAGLEKLSPEAQHFRFFAAKKRFSDEELRQLTEIDHKTHEAWGAIDLSHDDGEPIGVARYVTHPDDPDVAEVAVTVLDSHKGRGLGSLLLGVLACRACENEIARFHSIELAENEPLFNLVNGLEPEKRFVGDGQVELAVPLHRDASRYPDTIAGDVFRRASALYREAAGRQV